MVPLPHLSNEVLENTFLNVLDPLIRAKVQCWKASGLQTIMKKAQLMEDKEKTEDY